MRAGIITSIVGIVVIEAIWYVVMAFIVSAGINPLAGLVIWLLGAIFWPINYIGAIADEYENERLRKEFLQNSQEGV